jgi:OTT_1508-like deaminase
MRGWLESFWALRQRFYKADSERLAKKVFNRSESGIDNYLPRERQLEEIQPEKERSELRELLLGDYKALANSEEGIEFDEESFREYWKSLSQVYQQPTLLSQLQPTSARQVETYRALAKRKQADRLKPKPEEQQNLAEGKRTGRVRFQQDKMTLADDFYRLVKAVNLLKMIPSILQRLLKFREVIRQERVEVKVEWISCKGGYKAKKSDIIKSLRSLSSSHESFTKEMDKAVENLLPRDDEISLHFHCELQLTDRFLDDDKVEDYLGCSKTSCHFCWSILQYTRFRTKSTHSKLYWACAFPFSVEGNKINRDRLVRGVAKTQKKLADKLSKVAESEVYFYSQYPPGTETLGRGSDEIATGLKSQPRPRFHMFVDEQGNQTRG